MFLVSILAIITRTFSAQNIDYRVEFSKWFQLEFKTVKFPSSGTVFDYCIEKENLRFTPWSEKIPKFELDPDTPLQVGSGSCNCKQGLLPG